LFDEKRIHRILESASAQGRSSLLEPEALQVVEALSIRVPRHFVVNADDLESLAATSLEALPGDRVVLKAVGSGLHHKSRAGALRIVPKEAASVLQTGRVLLERTASLGAEAVLVEEFVPYPPGFGRELLIGLSYSASLGPLVTVGSGGTETEVLSRFLDPRTAVASWSPDLLHPWDIESGIRRLSLWEPLERLAAAEDTDPQTTLTRLSAIIETFAAAARFVPLDLQELEVNPLVYFRGDFTAVDALVRLGESKPDPRHTPGAPPRPLSKLEHLLQPCRLAIVGVSEHMNPGRAILQNTIAAGFPKDQVFVVKPDEKEIDGCRCVPTLSDLPPPVDLLVVAVEADEAARVVAEAAARDAVHSIILISGGFEEKEGARARVEVINAALGAARRRPDRGPLLNGGNCLGIRSIPGRYDTLFIPSDRLPRFRGQPSPLALVSQSGAQSITLMSRFPALNPLYTVTVGNQTDLTVGDFLEGFVERTEIDVVGVYVEGFRPSDGLRFFRAARRLRDRGGIVVLYKAARTRAGVDASSSHTASISGEFEVIRRLALQTGVLFAQSLADFEDLVRLSVMLGSSPPGDRLVVVSNAGFECVAAADHGGFFALQPFSEDLRRSLNALLEPRRIASIVNVRNPLDITPMADAELCEGVLRSLLISHEFDLVVLGAVPLTPALDIRLDEQGRPVPGSLPDRLGALRRDLRRPWICVIDGGTDYDPLVEALGRARIPVFRKMDRAIRILSQFCGR
jgi:acyl-CoA synthetase (NDP forming)